MPISAVGVQAQALLGFLLDQQKPAVVFDHRGNGDVRFPAGVHT